MVGDTGGGAQRGGGRSGRYREHPGGLGGGSSAKRLAAATGPHSRAARGSDPPHDARLAGCRWGAGLVARTANVAVITGSSRTSDIELQLTLGMHGPKELHVVLLRWELSAVSYQQNSS